MQTQTKLELLQAEVDDNDQSFFRLLADNQTIKYVTVEPGIYSAEDMCFGPSLTSLLLPILPPGEWNDGLVSRNKEDNQPHFAHARHTKFPGVKNTWHATYIEYMDITVGEKLRTGIYEITSPILNGIAVAKFARFDWEIGYMENETRAYQWIDGHDIGPRFLGHLTEHGRVIGFVMERVVNARHAGSSPGDLELCRETLSRMHELGVRHGDTNRFNFLICGSRAVLIDFESARKCCGHGKLEEEMEGLGGRLGDLGGGGGGGRICIE